MEAYKFNVLPNPEVTLIGSAREARGRALIDLLNFGASEVDYSFRVRLPQIQQGTGQISCRVEDDGKVSIKGIINRGEIFNNSSTVHKMKFNQLCPQQSFGISFNLPGPIDRRFKFFKFRSDLILDIVIRKRQQVADGAIDK